MLFKRLKYIVHQMGLSRGVQKQWGLKKRNVCSIRWVVTKGFGGHLFFERHHEETGKHDIEV